MVASVLSQRMNNVAAITFGFVRSFLLCTEDEFLDKSLIGLCVGREARPPSIYQHTFKVSTLAVSKCFTIIVSFKSCHCALCVQPLLIRLGKLGPCVSSFVR